MADLGPQNYLDPRPAEYFEGFHHRARTREPNWVYDVVRVVTSLVSLGPYRLVARGTHHVPTSGPLILSPNHFSNMDHFFSGVWIRRRIRFIAKSQIFGNPAGDFIFSRGGVFPVRRGQRDDEPFITALEILRRGGCVLMYAEGGRSRSGELGDPRPGIGRLALQSGAPVVPVAIHGSSGVRRIKRLRFPQVTLAYGEPLRFEPLAAPGRDLQQAAAERIFAEVRSLYEALAIAERGWLPAEMWRESRREVLDANSAIRIVEPASPSSPHRGPER